MILTLWPRQAILALSVALAGLVTHARTGDAQNPPKIPTERTILAQLGREHATLADLRAFLTVEGLDEAGIQRTFSSSTARERALNELLVRRAAYRMGLTTKKCALSPVSAPSSEVRLMYERLCYQLLQRATRAQDEAEAAKKRDLIEERARELYATLPRAPGSATFQHIVFVVERYGFDGVIERIRQARDRLAAGEDFASVARDLSDDADAKNTGGLIQDVREDGMDAVLRRKLFVELSPGQYSNDPVTSRRGLHLVRLVSRTDPARPPFDAVAETLRKRATEDFIEARARERYAKEDKVQYRHEYLAAFDPVPDPVLDAKVRELVQSLSRRPPEAPR